MTDENTPTLPTLDNASTEVAKAEDSPRQFDASELVVPRVYFRQLQSEAVTVDGESAGSAIIAVGGDDEDPWTLIPGFDQKVSVYVYDHASFVVENLPEGSFKPRHELTAPRRGTDEWFFYQYGIYVPGYDVQPWAGLPVVLSLWKTWGRDAARTLNTVYLANQHANEGLPFRIELWSRKEIGKKSGLPYVQAKAKLVTPDEHYEDALAMQQTYGGFLQAQVDAAKASYSPEPENTGPSVL
jgi:hypothetical protein